MSTTSSRHPLVLAGESFSYEDWGIEPPLLLRYIRRALCDGETMPGNLAAVAKLHAYGIGYDLEAIALPDRFTRLTILVSVEEEAQFRLIESA